jgi:hypothetical protein
MSSDKEDEELSNVIDIRSRLPKLIESMQPAERMAHKICDVFMTEEVPVYEYFAALMVVSHYLQAQLRLGFNASEDHIRFQFSRAMDIAATIKLGDSPRPPKDAG